MTLLEKSVSQSANDSQGSTFRQGLFVLQFVFEPLWYVVFEPFEQLVEGLVGQTVVLLQELPAIRIHLLIDPALSLAQTLDVFSPTLLVAIPSTT